MYNFTIIQWICTVFHISITCIISRILIFHDFASTMCCTAMTMTLWAAYYYRQPASNSSVGKLGVTVVYAIFVLIIIVGGLLDTG
jgi:hypothetical protein